MTTPVWDREGYLGNVALIRDGEPREVPADSIHVETGTAGHLRYWRVPSTGTEAKVFLRPADRKTARLVMEDDTPERLEALRRALLADRWRHVAARA
jgi:hypothetical protein